MFPSFLLSQRGGLSICLNASAFIQVSLVDDTLRFAFASRDRLGRHELNHTVNTEHGFECGDELLLSCGDLLEGVGEHLRRHLDLHLDAVAVVGPCDDDLVVGRIAAVEQYGLDLGREYVDALYDQHVVASSHGLGHSHMGPAAGARLIVQNTDVLGPVADQRKCFLGNAGEYDLTLLAVRNRLSGLGIDGLHDEMVLWSSLTCMPCCSLHSNATPGPEISVRP